MGDVGSLSRTEQTDQSVNVGEAQKISGAGSILSEPGSFVISERAKIEGDITYNQFPSDVKESITDLVKTVESVTTSAIQSSGQTSQGITDTLKTQQIGSGSIVPDLAVYALIGFGLYLLLRKLS